MICPECENSKWSTVIYTPKQDEPEGKEYYMHERYKILIECCRCGWRDYIDTTHLSIFKKEI